MGQSLKKLKSKLCYHSESGVAFICQIICQLCKYNGLIFMKFRSDCVRLSIAG